VPYLVIGNGSNLLVSDDGIRGAVIEMLDRSGDIEIADDRINVAAGMLLSKTAKLAADNGLAGMEFASGIPGTLGGAVVMNAGAYGGEMKDIVESVIVIDENGSELRLGVDELQMGYRTSIIADRGYVVIEVSLKLRRDNTDDILTRMKELNSARLSKQPLEYPSAGSTFKRPEGYFAGKLIMDAGLKGYRVGGAQVSEKHCGFVINRGDATAADIMQLMSDVICRVKENSGVTLEPEVKIIGEFK
jgi:UDP-N-acetylmuramate dehydrogenase